MPIRRFKSKIYRKIKVVNNIHSQIQFLTAHSMQKIIWHIGANQRFHSKAQKPTIFNNGCYTTNIPTDPHTVTTTDIKTNMRHIHTSIVSRHLATRGNNKILRTPPQHISSSEEIIPRLTHHTLAQLRINKSPFLKSYLHKVNAKSHPSPLHPLCNTHTHTSFLQLHPHTHHIITPGFVDRLRGMTALLARWMEKLVGGPQAGRLDTPPPH